MKRWCPPVFTKRVLCIVASVVATTVVGDERFDPDRTWQTHTLAGEVRVALPVRPAYSEPPSADPGVHTQRFRAVLPRLAIDIMITRRDHPGPLRLDDAAEALHQRLVKLAASKQGRLVSFTATPISRGSLQGRELNSLIAFPGQPTRNRGLAFAHGGTVWIIQAIYREDDDVAKRGADHVLSTFEVIAKGA